MAAKPKEEPIAAPAPDLNPKGLECHRCGCKHLFVVWTRPATGKRTVRRRKCRNCGTLLYTTEKLMGS